MWLKKQNAIKKNVNVVYVSNTVGQYQMNQYALDNNCFEEVHACMHALLKIGKTYYHSSGNAADYVKRHKTAKFLVIPQDKTEIFLEHSIKTDNWSEYFNRRKGIPMIEKILGIELTNIKT